MRAAQREISNDISMCLIQTAPISKFDGLMNLHKQARIISRICNPVTTVLSHISLYPSYFYITVNSIS